MEDRELKVVVLGGSTVGKTCIVYRATTGGFDSESMPTLGASYTSKSVALGRRTYLLQIWDTAGQERYRSLAPMYYRGSHAALIVYSIADRSSFDEIDTWIDDFRENTEQAAVFIVGNKADLVDARQVAQREGREKALTRGTFFSEVSALTGDGIEALFAMIPEGCELEGDKRVNEQRVAAPPQPAKPPGRKREFRC
jgi:small GTP-binding protein